MYVCYTPIPKIKCMLFISPKNGYLANYHEKIKTSHFKNNLEFGRFKRKPSWQPIPVISTSWEAEGVGS
jgi:hypothetical protein